jgi:hypothetical protein
MTSIAFHRPSIAFHRGATAFVIGPAIAFDRLLSGFLLSPHTPGADGKPAFSGLRPSGRLPGAILEFDPSMIRGSLMGASKLQATERWRDGRNPQVPNPAVPRTESRS